MGQAHGGDYLGTMIRHLLGWVLYRHYNFLDVKVGKEILGFMETARAAKDFIERYEQMGVVSPQLYLKLKLAVEAISLRKQ